LPEKPQIRYRRPEFKEGCVEFSRRNDAEIRVFTRKNPHDRHRFERGRKNGSNCGPDFGWDFTPGVASPDTPVPGAPVPGAAAPDELAS